MTTLHIALWAVMASGGALLFLSALYCGLRAGYRRLGIALLLALALCGLTACKPSPDTVDSTYTTHVTGVIK